MDVKFGMVAQWSAPSKLQVETSESSCSVFLGQLAELFQHFLDQAPAVGADVWGFRLRGSPCSASLGRQLGFVFSGRWSITRPEAARLVGSRH